MEQDLREKVGQLFMVGFDGLQPDDHIRRLIREYKVGGVILFRRNVQSPAQVSQLCHELQQLNAEVSESPLLISIDQEGGMVMRIEQGVTPIPSAMAFQAAGSVPDCERMNRVSGDEMRQLGINLMLAPVLDINNNRDNPVIGVRAYGEDAATVIDYGLAAMRGQQSAGVAVTAKHFPGHGDTATDTHHAMAQVGHDKARLQAVELAPFRAAIAAGVDAIMTAHVMFPAFEGGAGVPATLSKNVLSGLLRGEMDFEGAIISDCLEMAAIADGVGVAQGALGTLQAGADIALISHSQARQIAAIETVIQAVQDGAISMQQIDAAVARVARLKQVAAAREWRERPLLPPALMTPESLALSQQLHAAALRVQGPWRSLDPALPVTLITVEVRTRSEIDEVALGRNQEARGSMLPALQAAGLTVREFALSVQAPDDEVDAAIAFAQGTQQIVLQSYNAVLSSGQRRLIAALAHEQLWLVAGRLPYDMDLAPGAQGRLAAFGCRPAALAPVAQKLAAD